MEHQYQINIDNVLFISREAAPPGKMPLDDLVQLCHGTWKIRKVKLRKAAA